MDRKIKKISKNTFWNDKTGWELIYNEHTLKYALGLNLIQEP